MKKKSITLVLAFMMLFALTACSNNDSNASNSDTATPSEAASSSDTAEVSESTEADNASSEITTVSEGVLVMATNAEFPPYEYYEGGEVIGIDAEIAGAIADKLGLTLQIDDMDFTSIVAAVQSGKADMGMAGMTVREDRLQSVDFSISYATGVQVVIVNEDSAITSVDDLLADGANHNIGVQESTTGDIYSSEDIEDAGLGTIHRYNKGADAVQALVAGKVDCVIIDNEPAKAFIEANDGLKILDTEYISEDYAICFNKENTAFSTAVDEALQELIDDGTVQKIIDKYITAE